MRSEGKNEDIAENSSLNPFNDDVEVENQGKVQDILLSKIKSGFSGDILSSLNLEVNSKIEVLWHVTYANGDEKAIWWKCNIVRKVKDSFYTFEDELRSQIYEVLYEKKEPFFGSEETAYICFLSDLTIFDVNISSVLEWRRCDSRLGLFQLLQASNIAELQQFIRKCSKNEDLKDSIDTTFSENDQEQNVKHEIDRKIEEIVEHSLKISNLDINSLGHDEKALFLENIRKMKEIISSKLTAKLRRNEDSEKLEITEKMIQEIISDMRTSG